MNVLPMINVLWLLPCNNLQSVRNISFRSAAIRRARKECLRICTYWMSARINRNWQAIYYLIQFSFYFSVVVARFLARSLTRAFVIISPTLFASCSTNSRCISWTFAQIIKSKKHLYVMRAHSRYRTTSIRKIDICPCVMANFNELSRIQILLFLLSIGCFSFGLGAAVSMLILDICSLIGFSDGIDRDSMPQHRSAFFCSCVCVGCTDWSFPVQFVGTCILQLSYTDLDAPHVVFWIIILLFFSHWLSFFFCSFLMHFCPKHYN